MTRWARANNVHKHKPAEATPWSQLKGAGGGGGRGPPGHSGGPKQGAQKDPLRRTQPAGSAVKKPNRKKKEYVDEDVNGFMEYLQQSGQQLPRGDTGGRSEEQEIREEVETALKKDRRREDRRLKRQKDKKNKMVSVCTAQTPGSRPGSKQQLHQNLCVTDFNSLSHIHTHVIVCCLRVS